MQKHRLGQTDIFVSQLGLGTVKFGRQVGVKYPSSFHLPTDQEINTLLGLSADLGINLLDTAPAYGTSEERLGKALVGKRQAWVISTKAGEQFRAGQSFFDFTAQAIISSVERSLRQLKTDYLDILLVHSNGHDHYLIEQLDVFATLNHLKQAGKIRSFGMSTKTIEGGRLTIEAADLAMVTFNLNETAERSVIEHARHLNKGIFIKKALGSGHLPAEEAMRFVLAEPGVSSVIIGTINPEHLRQHARFVSNT